jgi:hypothetical protein
VESKLCSSTAENVKLLSADAESDLGQDFALIDFEILSHTSSSFTLVPNARQERRLSFWFPPLSDWMVKCMVTRTHNQEKKVMLPIVMIEANKMELS